VRPKINQKAGQLGLPHIGMTEIEKIELKHKTDEHLSPMNGIEPFQNCFVSVSLGTLKTRDWKKQDWKTRDQIARVEKAGLENAGPCGTGWKTRDLKSMESVTVFKSKSYGAEIKIVNGDDSADDTDASTNAVVATVITPATDSNDLMRGLPRPHRDPRIALVSCGHQRFCEPCANEVERQGRGCPICRTDIQMILRLF